MKRPSIRNLMLTTAMLALGVVSTSGATITVTTSADTGPGSLRDAVALATAGDSIVFDVATNGVPILLLSGEISIGVPLTIVGNDTSNTVVSGSDLSRIFSISGASTVKLVALSMTMGQSATDGGALIIQGSDVELWDCVISNSSAGSRGGGIYANGGSLLTMGTSIRGNIASGAAAAEGGGGVYNDANMLTINASSSITDNLANGISGSGGGLFTSSGTVQVIASSLSGNSANRAGGAIEIVAGILFLTNSDLTGNDVAGGAGVANPGNGGGLHATGAPSIAVNGGSVTGNVAGREGGGLWNSTGTMTIDGTTIDGNTASGPASHDGGGGVFNNGGTLIIQNGTMITGNSADGVAGSGGGVFNEVGGTLTVTSSTISGNSAVRAGGGIEDNSGSATMVTLSMVTLDENSTGAAPGNGGGMHITGAGNAMITGGTVSGNTAALEGGGLWNGAGTMVVDGTTIDGNTASGALADQGGGGIFNLAGNLTVQNGTVISNNMAIGTAGSGGGIMNDTLATLTVLNSTLSGNSSKRAGGGIEVFAKAGFITTLTGVTVSGNSTGAAPGNGGGFHITGPGIVNVNGGSFTGNTATQEGGGLWNSTGTMTIDGATISGNTASGVAADDGGGGLFNNGGTMFVQNASVISGNTASGAAGSGGGVFNNGGVITIDASTISMNECVRAGGGIESLAGTVTVSGSVLNGNDASTSGALATVAPGNGGAVHVTGAGTFMISGSTVDGNAAGNEGGGLWASNSGSMTVSRSTVSNNTSPDGGGLFLQGGGGDTGVLNVQYSTISGNSGTNGGGVQTEGGSLSLLASTIANNTATTGGGSNVVAGSVSANSSLIADNTASTGPDFNGAFAAVSFTLVEDGSGATGITDGASGNIVGTDPGLLALADNGGATLTHAVGCGSAALDAGDPAQFGNDQRDLAVFNGQRDLGAFEYQDVCGGTCTQLELVFGLDAFGSQTTWQITPSGGGAPVASGGPYADVPGGSTQTATFCLADGCYALSVFDSAGDGITMGGYVLRTSDGDRIIDNAGNFTTGSISAVAANFDNGAFCLPLSTDRLILSQFDKVDWVNFKYLVATENVAVSATWVPNGANSVQPTNSGYVFWIFDPNGTYSYRRFRSHNVSDGFSPANALRVNHLKINGWVNTVTTPHIPANVLMNVRVRSRVAGVNGAFGPATRFMIDPARAACPLTKLQDAAGPKYSCGVSRNFASGSAIYAKPPQFIPAVNASLLRYQFRFRHSDSGFETIRQSNTYVLPLYWTGPTALQCGLTYTVDVRVSKDLGATWCIDSPVPATPFSAWGDVCTVTINPCSGFDEPTPPVAILSPVTVFTIYPNPNSGDQLFVSLTGLERGLDAVNLDIYDLTGKRVHAQRLSTTEGPLNTKVELGATFSNGVYLVNITAGEQTWNQRLVIQR